MFKEGWKSWLTYTPFMALGSSKDLKDYYKITKEENSETHSPIYYCPFCKKYYENWDYYYHLDEHTLREVLVLKNVILLELKEYGTR